MILNNFKVKNNFIKIWNFNRWINWIIFALQFKKKHYKLLFSWGIVHKWRHLILYNLLSHSLKRKDFNGKTSKLPLTPICLDRAIIYWRPLTPTTVSNFCESQCHRFEKKKFSEFYLRLSNGGIFTLFCTHTHTYSFFSSQKKFKENLRQKKEQSVFFDQI